MTDPTIQKAIDEFEEGHPGIRISYGGDGALLAQISDFMDTKSYLPIRNYGLCDKHQDIVNRLKSDSFVESLTKTRHRLLEAAGAYRDGNPMDFGSVNAVAEITAKSADPTIALRFNVFVNGNMYLENCIADAVIYSSEMGSHGYWKSVTRTIFRGGDNVGFGFLAPTYGINNLVLKGTDIIEMKFNREAPVVMTYDKRVVNEYFMPGDSLRFSQSSKKNVEFLGYDIFCCYNCRKNRNSTTLNDMYFT